jgi:hypothetical protein
MVAGECIPDFEPGGDHKMSEVKANLNQVLRVLEQFSPQELAVIEERLAARNRVSEQPLDAVADLFDLPFDDYLAMSREERDAIALRAYQTLGTWIDAELKRLGAEWMLVCGGQVIESSPTLQNYPSREKLMQAGRQRGLVPFVFVREPLIEEAELDDFELEVEMLRNSEEFMSFLDERSKERATTSIEELRKELGIG